MSKKKIKNICYVPSLNMGVIYWRIENYAQKLVSFKNDCAVHVNYLFNPYQSVAWDALAVGRGKVSEEIQTNLAGACSFFDVMIFQKIQNIEAVALLDQYKKDYPNVLFLAEIDDAIGDTQPSNPYVNGDHHQLAAQHCQLSDGLIVSTDYLGRSIRKIVGDDMPIHVAPNCINTDTWKVKRKRQVKEGFNVCYVGAAAHDEDLVIAYKAMLPILNEKNDIRFTIRYGGYRPDWLEDHPKIDFKMVAWDVSEYAQKLYNLNCDLALAPLRDTEMNRCKSNIKWLEWSTLGVPTICSDVIPYRGNDYLCPNDSYEWEIMIRKVSEQIQAVPIDKKELRKQARERYNIKKECRSLLGFFDKLC